MATDDNRESGFDPRRQLCPDGSCIGVIGPDGRCTECGAPETSGNAAAVPAPETTDELVDDDEPESATDEAEEAGPAFDAKRRLCSDGSCIGVVGSNNRCQVCGKPAD
jgi:hypothetical protein